MEHKYKVGILGATGIVGQELVKLLINNSKFEIEELGASQNSIGKTYREICRKMNNIDDNIIFDKILKACVPENFKNCDLIFSVLPGDIAGDIERNFFLADFPIISNSSFYRNNPEVPLIVPYINNQHLQLIHKQRSTYNLQKGFLITNANCVVTGVMYALYNLHKTFNIKQMNIVTMQAVSGAGYNGVSAYDICNNVIPYINREEEKLKNEPLKILGELNNESNIINANIEIDSTCNRVNVINGHTSCISLKFDQSIKHIDLTEIKDIIINNNNCIQIFDDNIRPQPRIDNDYQNGFGISIGRLRKSNYWDLEMTIVSNNIVLGAAGSSILNAELCINNSYI